MISGNYSDSNISRHRDFILKCQSQIQNLIDQRRTAFDKFTKDEEEAIQNNLEWTGYERVRHSQYLSDHKAFVEEINSQIFELLDAKSNSFDVLSRLTELDEIDVFLIDGKFWINEPEAPSTNASQQLPQ